MSVGIIASAAYITPELAAELGALPPAFVPVGNQRLFKAQVALLSRLVDRIVLTLPQSFEPTEHDTRLLSRLGVIVQKIPDGLSLCESLTRALIQSLNGNERAVILHGDTLFTEIETFPEDGFSVHRGEHLYSWAMVGADQAQPIQLIDEDTEGDALLVSGLFSVSHGYAFLRCLAAAQTDFLAALNTYMTQCLAFRADLGLGHWFDFGHINTYYDSRRALTTQRSFNALSITSETVSKTSDDTGKMAAEAAWFEQLPQSLHGMIPAYLGRLPYGDNRAGYRLSYEYLCPLSDLYVFGAAPPVVWRRILRNCADVLARMREFKPDAVNAGWFSALYAAKTKTRLAQFCKDVAISPALPWRINGEDMPAPLQIIEEMAAQIGQPQDGDVGILHGDFCFSNILFDFRRGCLKLIDPRGYIEPGCPSVFGDTRYDLGKLYQSIAGRYDFIVAGYYDLASDGDYGLRFTVPAAKGGGQIEVFFRQIICGGDAARERTAAAIAVLLFFSMLPLHGDDRGRQWALFANGYRLYRDHFAVAA